MAEFEEAGEMIIEGALAGMLDVGLKILAESLEECPIDTGTLRESAGIMPSLSGVQPGFTIGYGWGNAINPKTRRPVSEYAVPVHEILEAYHEPPTKAKYLEDPLFMHARELEFTMNTKAKEALTASVLTGKKGVRPTPLTEFYAGSPRYTLTDIPGFGGGSILRGPGGRFAAEAG